MPNRGRPLWLRLTITYVAVALLGVLLVAGISAFLGERYLNNLVQERRDDLTRALLVSAASTYNTGHPGWSDVDLRPALGLASRSGTDVAVADAHGHVVVATFPHPRRAPNTQQRPITVHGVRVGTLYVTFNGRGLVQSVDNLRRSLLHADVWAAGVAALLALGAAILVARRLSRPVHRLTEAAAAMSRGDRQVRLGHLRGAPTELQNLAGTFDRMSDTLVREEQIRRDLVADVAHELRTPVAVLQANCEALLDGIVPHTREQTASLHEEVVRIGAMVGDLEALASAEAAALQLTLVRCDLATITELAVDAFESKIAAAGLHVTRDLTSAVIEGDPARLHQVVTNLLSNAVKFTPPGGSIQVSVGKSAGHAILTIRDSGLGITNDQLPHIFERFWRAPGLDPTTGSGIGLAIVHGLVTAHGGRITVDSRPGHGTRVTVLVPLAG